MIEFDVFLMNLFFNEKTFYVFFLSEKDPGEEAVKIWAGEAIRATESGVLLHACAANHKQPGEGKSYGRSAWLMLFGYIDLSFFCSMEVLGLPNPFFWDL